MDRLGLDAVVFPAVADVGHADKAVNEPSADIGWSNGVWVANGNLAIRHLGVPTVRVPMGAMADIGMPVGLTFAGRAYETRTASHRGGVRGDGRAPDGTAAHAAVAVISPSGRARCRRACLPARRSCRDDPICVVVSWFFLA